MKGEYTDEQSELSFSRTWFSSLEGAEATKAADLGELTSRLAFLSSTGQSAFQCPFSRQ